jgi:hypothetical protein
MQCYIVKYFNVAQLENENKIEPFSIFTYVCAKFHDLIPLLGKYCLFQKNKLLLGM